MRNQRSLSILIGPFRRELIDEVKRNVKVLNTSMEDLLTKLEKMEQFEITQNGNFGLMAPVLLDQVNKVLIIF